jgi:hypothetical protein
MDFKYERENGDKCTTFKLVKKNTKYYPGILYGDIVYEEDGYRALNSYIYCNDGFVKLSSMGPGNGSGGITKDVTKYIENPKTFFSMNAIYAGDIAEIELDTKAHYSLLKKKAGNRDISDKFEFVISYYNDKPEIYFESAKLYDGSTHELKLTSKLDDVYLSGKDFTEIDPITLRRNNKSKEKYDKIMPEVLCINNNLHYRLETKNSFCGGMIEIIDIKYDDEEKSNPIEVICEDPYNLGIYGINQTLFKFYPIMEKDKSIPTWTCTDINFDGDTEMFEYDKINNKYKLKLTLSII